MEHQLRVIAYLLAALVGTKTDRSAEEWLKSADEYAGGESYHPMPESPSEAAKSAKDAEMESAVEEIYKMYPTKCPNRGVATGKCSKDKARIRTLLKTKSAEEIKQSITQYLEDCRISGQYLKNFGTLLNNLPEVVSDDLFPTELPSPQPSSEYR